jgi:hypothetical protein
MRSLNLVLLAQNNFDIASCGASNPATSRNHRLEIIRRQVQQSAGPRHHGSKFNSTDHCGCALCAVQTRLSGRVAAGWSNHPKYLGDGPERCFVAVPVLIRIL